MALTAGQAMLLQRLAEDGARIWRSPSGLQLVSPMAGWVKLTEATVQTMVTAGYVRQVEAYGRDRGLYEISDAGKMALRVTS